MLDVGGASGVIAYLFKDTAWRSCVIDPSEDGTFIRKYGVGYVQEFYKAGLFEKKFNLISLVFVLEHLLDPLAIIKEVARIW